MVPAPGPRPVSVALCPSTTDHPVLTLHDRPPTVRGAPLETTDPGLVVESPRTLQGVLLECVCLRDGTRKGVCPGPSWSPPRPAPRPISGEE